MLHVTVESVMLRYSRTVYEPLNSLIGYSVLTGGVVNRIRGIYVLPAGVVRCQSQVSSSFATISPFLGWRMSFVGCAHASDIPCIGSGGTFEAIKLSKGRLCCFPTNSHARIVPIFARRYDVDIRRFERQRLKYTFHSFALFRSHFEYHS